MHTHLVTRIVATATLAAAAWLTVTTTTPAVTAERRDGVRREPARRGPRRPAPREGHRPSALDAEGRTGRPAARRHRRQLRRRLPVPRRLRGTAGQGQAGLRRARPRDHLERPQHQPRTAGGCAHRVGGVAGRRLAGRFHLATPTSTCTTVGTVAADNPIAVGDVATTETGGAALAYPVAQGPIRIAGSVYLTGTMTALGANNRAFLPARSRHQPARRRVAAQRDVRRHGQPDARRRGAAGHRGPPACGPRWLRKAR